MAAGRAYRLAMGIVRWRGRRARPRNACCIFLCAPSFRTARHIGGPPVCVASVNERGVGNETCNTRTEGRVDLSAVTANLVDPDFDIRVGGIASISNSADSVPSFPIGTGTQASTYRSRHDVSVAGA